MGTRKRSISFFPFLSATITFSGMNKSKELDGTVEWDQEHEGFSSINKYFDGMDKILFLGYPGTTPRSIKDQILEPHR